MTKVFRLTDRLETKKKKQQAETYRNKLKAIQRTVRCAFCNLKCSMCGQYLSKEEVAYSLFSSSDGFNLCESCGSEFEDFIRISTNHTSSGMFWHKEAWLKLWAAWVDYQEALKAFKDSPEFQELSKELEE